MQGINGNGKLLQLSLWNCPVLKQKPSFENKWQSCYLEIEQDTH